MKKKLPIFFHYYITWKWKGPVQLSMTIIWASSDGKSVVLEASGLNLSLRHRLNA